MTTVPEATGAAPARAYGKQFVVLWLVISAILTPLVVIFLGPKIPPGNGSVQASEQVFSNEVMLGVVTPVCVLVLLFLIYALAAFRARGAGGRRRPADPRRLRDPDRLGGRDDRDGALPRRLRHLRAAQERLRRWPGPDGRVPSGRALERDGRAGDRAAVGVDVPLPDLRGRRDAAPRPAGEHADQAARHLAGRGALLLGVPARREGRREPRASTTSPTSRRRGRGRSRSTAPSSAASGTATCSTPARSCRPPTSRPGSSSSRRTSRRSPSTCRRTRPPTSPTRSSAPDEPAPERKEPSER